MDGRYIALKRELKTATIRHYNRLIATIPDIYGYSLYTEDGVCGIGPVANREIALTRSPLDSTYNYYRYSPDEWSEWDDFGLFDAANNIIKDLHNDNNIEFAEKRDVMLFQAIDVLSELEAEGIFGPKDDHRFVVLWLCDSGSRLIPESVKRLNSESVFRAYIAEFPLGSD